jgi:hypothetical protein
MTQAPPIRLRRAPQTEDERKTLRKMCRAQAKAHGFTGNRAMSEANRLYFDAVAESQHQVREPAALKPVVQEAPVGVLLRALPRNMRESASGLIVPVDATR